MPGARSREALVLPSAAYRLALALLCPFFTLASRKSGTIQARMEMAVMLHVGVSLPQALLCWLQRMDWPCPYIS